MTQKSAGLTRSLLFSRLPQAAIVGAIISCLRAGSRTQKCNVLVAAVCISGRMPLKRELQGTRMADKLGYSFSLWRQRSSAGQPSTFRAIPVASWGTPPANGVSCNMQRGRMGAGKKKHGHTPKLSEQQAASAPSRQAPHALHVQPFQAVVSAAQRGGALERPCSSARLLVPFLIYL